METGTRPGGLATGLLVSIFLLSFLLLGLDILDDPTPPRKDALQYLALAWNLHHHGTLSLARDEPPDPVAPSAYREPLYPVFLAIGMKLTPRIRAAPQALLQQEEFQAALRPLKQVQLLLLLIAALCAMGMVSEITGRPVLAWAALFLVGLDGSLLALAGSFLSEPLIVAELAAFSYACVRLAGRPTLPAGATAGLLLALLALTRAAFFYFWVPAALLFALAAWRRPAWRARILRAGILFLACFFVPTGAWMARNLRHFGRAFIAERGGVILAIRAGMDGMTRQEYLASFLYWSNSPWLNERLLADLFPEEATVRLDPDEPSGFVQRARARRRELNEELGDPVLADRRQLREAGREILSHPLGHLLVTLPILHRGIYVKPRASHSILLWICFAAAFAAGLRARAAPATAALSPALLSFLFHAGLTHNIPRYNLILIPFLWISVLVCVDRALSRSRPGGAVGPGAAGAAPGLASTPGGAKE